MTHQFSPAVRNARLNAYEATIGTGAVLEIRTGPPPANGAARTGVVVATVALPSDWMADAVNGTKAMSGTWSDPSADASGYAGNFSIKDSAGVYHDQGIVAEPWAASKNLVVGQQVYNGTHAYACTAAGATGTTGPVFTSGSAADGTATIAYIGEVDMKIDNTNFVTGQTFNITGYSLTDGNA